MKTKELSPDTKASGEASASGSAASGVRPEPMQSSPPTEAPTSGGANLRSKFQEMVESIGELNCSVLASAFSPGGPDPAEVEKLAEALHRTSLGLDDVDYEKYIGQPRRHWRKDPTAPWDRNRSELCEWERDEYREQARLLLSRFYFRLAAIEDLDRTVEALSEIICICAPDAEGKYNYEQIAWDVEEWARWGLSPNHTIKPFEQKGQGFKTMAEVDEAYFPNVTTKPRKP